MKAALLGSSAAKPIEIWFQDEARVGQQRSLEYIWAPIGSRPFTEVAPGAHAVLVCDDAG